MPTYRNDSATENITIINAAGEEVILEPGDSSDAIKFYVITDLTKTADTPYINPIGSTVDATTEEDGEFDLSTANVEGVKVRLNSGEINVYYQSKTNTPPALSTWVSTSSVYTIPTNGNCDKLIVEAITSAASCDMIEIKGKKLLG